MGKDFLGNDYPDKCMGCAIQSSDMIPQGGLLYRSDSFHVNQDPLVPMPGFLVIAANRHIQHIDDFSDSEFLEYSHLIRLTRKVIREIFHIETVTMVEEEFSIHFHTWFFPWTKKSIANRLIFQTRGSPFRTTS